ncbi:MAG: hypothetical protein KF716_27270 [Anaerolineae bacterium]|nr:hypothetical protein [Anaerolineae bacterium]
MRLLGRVLGTDHLPAPYNPFVELERVNPLLRRELKLVQQGQPHYVLALYDNQFLRIAVVIHALSMCGCCLASASAVPLMPIMTLTLPSLIISIGADCYANVRTIFRWHSASQRETWDAMRLAMRDDEELISTYETIGNVRSWTGFRLDMTMRAVPAAILAVVGAALIIGALVSLLLSIRPDPMQVIELILMGFFFIRVAILYISDPRWRFRTNTIWSLLCAIRFHDTAAAITVAIAGNLGVRLLHLSSLFAIYLASNEALGGEMVFGGRLDVPMAIRWFAWFAVLVFWLLPITRWGYTTVYNWLKTRACEALRTDEV